jgi:hypothetical protein
VKLIKPIPQRNTAPFVQHQGLNSQWSIFGQSQQIQKNFGEDTDVNIATSTHLPLNNLMYLISGNQGVPEKKYGDMEAADVHKSRWSVPIVLITS